MVTVTAFQGRINRVLLKGSVHQFGIRYHPAGDIDKNPILRRLFRIAQRNNQMLRLPNTTRSIRLATGTEIYQEEFESIFRILGPIGFSRRNGLGIWEKTLRYRNNMYKVHLIYGDLNPSITCTHPIVLKKEMSEYEAAMKGLPLGGISLTQKEAMEYLPYPERRMLGELKRKYCLLWVKRSAVNHDRARRRLMS